MKKRIIVMLLTLAMVLPLCPAGVLSFPVAAVTGEFAGGSGTAAEPYLISSKDHLNNVRNDLGAHYKMIADVVFKETDFAEDGTFYNNGQGWLPIGSESTPFTSVFDGGGHEISGIKINITDNAFLTDIGLFGYCNQATVSNLHIEGGKIGVSTSEIVYVGSIAGRMQGNMENCHNSSSITVNTTKEECYVGGTVGILGESKIIGRCSNQADISVSSTASSAAILNSGIMVGGIVGKTERGAYVQHCYNTGDVFAKGTAGITVGGIAGYNCYMLGESFNVGNITVETVSSSFGYVYCGGICGYAAKSSLNFRVGNVSNCYSAGESTKSPIGVGVSYGSGSSTITNCYHLVTDGSHATCDGCLTALEMKMPEAFVGFDFSSIWEFKANNHYPYPTLIENTYLGTNHAYSSDCDTTCNECGFIRTAPHVYDNACDIDCNECGHVRDVPDHVYDGETDGLCNECGYKREFSVLAFYGANLTLENDLTVNFAVQKSLIDNYGFTDFRVIFKLGNRTVTVSEYHEDQGYYLFSFKNLAPQMLGDEIEATLYATIDGTEFNGNTVHYTVTKYCKQVLADANASQDLKILIADLMQYAAAAQRYTNYKTDSLVTDLMTAEEKKLITAFAPEAESVSNAKYKEIASPSVQWTGASLNLYESVSIQLQFTASDITGLTAEVRDTRGRYLATLTEEEMTKSGSTYTLFYKGLNAGEMTKAVLITFYDAEGNAVSNTLRYSVESYVAIVHQYGGDAKLVALLDAMLNYGLSAEIYANS